MGKVVQNLMSIMTFKKLLINFYLEITFWNVESPHFWGVAYIIKSKRKFLI